MTYEPSSRPKWLPTHRSGLKTVLTWVAIALISFTIPRIVTRPRTEQRRPSFVEQLHAAWA